MNILLRTDAGGTIGLGHYFRTLNLAEILIKHGHTITLAHCNDDFWGTDPTFPKEIKLVLISDKNEEQMLKRICDEQEINILYVDLIKEFDEAAFNLLMKKVTVVFYQNITSSRFLADIFILPSIHQQEAFFSVFNRNTTIYKGLEYSIFNKKVTCAQFKTNDELRNVRKISIITGGSDPENVMMRLYSIINHSSYANINFEYNIGATFLFREDIPLQTDWPPNVTFIEYDFEKIIDSQVVVAAFGVSVYELLSLGMPVISVGHQTTTSNASRILAESTHALVDIGPISELSKEKINYTLNELINDQERRLNISQIAKSVIDKKGAERVAAIINKVKIKTK